MFYQKQIKVFRVQLRIEHFFLPTQHKIFCEKYNCSSAACKIKQIAFIFGYDKLVIYLY